MSTEIATQSQLQEVIVNGSEVLQKSELRVSKALSVGEKLVMEIDANGMNQDLDERANKFLVNCRNAKTEIEAERKPITAFFDTIRKQFTEIEGNLDPKKAGTFPARLQAHRDVYVKKLRDEEAEKQRIAQVKLDKDNEVIEIKSSLQTQFLNYMQDYVLDQKNKLQSSFNKITLENIDEKAKRLKNLVIHYGVNHIDTFSPNWLRKNVTQEETAALLVEFLTAKKNDNALLKEAIESDIRSFVNELIEKLPSLKTSLEEMAKAGAEEQQRLTAEKAKREADAQIKMEADAQAEKDRLAKAAELAKIADQTNAMMDNMVLAESVAPETRDGYKINLLNKTAIAEIFTFWFQREGMTLSIPEIEKKSITQMKAYCEKVGHKSGDMIQSVNLNYEPVYKAVNRK